MHHLMQAIWGDIWLHIVEKNQTNVTSVTLHLSRQATWNNIWKDTMEKRLKMQPVLFWRRPEETTYKHTCGGKTKNEWSDGWRIRQHFSLWFIIAFAFLFYFTHVFALALLWQCKWMKFYPVPGKNLRAILFLVVGPIGYRPNRGSWPEQLNWWPCPLLVSCPEQLNRWPCPLLGPSVCDH